MSRQLDAWREIAYRDGGAEMLSMSRPLLREMFDEMDAARAVAEADADRLAVALELAITFTKAGAEGRRALVAHDEAVAQR